MLESYYTWRSFRRVISGAMFICILGIASAPLIGQMSVMAGQEDKKEEDDLVWYTVGGQDDLKGGNEVGGHVARVSVREFWPEKVSASSAGYLVNAQRIPIRALASSYLVPLFDTEKTEYPRGVIDIMKPFTPYYIKKRAGEALLLAEEPNAPESLSYWARKSD